MYQHCPLILLELTLHASNYLVCGFVHLVLSDVHNMNFAHSTKLHQQSMEFRCVRGTRHVETDWRSSVKGHSYSKNRRVFTVEKESDTQLVIFYLYSQGVSDSRSTTEIIDLPFLWLFGSLWSLAQSTNDLTRSVVAETLLHISVPSVALQHTLRNT